MEIDLARRGVQGEQPAPGEQKTPIAAADRGQLRRGIAGQLVGRRRTSPRRCVYRRPPRPSRCSSPGSSRSGPRPATRPGCRRPSPAADRHRPPACCRRRRSSARRRTSAPCRPSRAAGRRRRRRNAACPRRRRGRRGRRRSPASCAVRCCSRRGLHSRSDTRTSSGTRRSGRRDKSVEPGPRNGRIGRSVPGPPSRCRSWCPACGARRRAGRCGPSASRCPSRATSRCRPGRGSGASRRRRRRAPRCGRLGGSAAQTATEARTSATAASPRRTKEEALRANSAMVVFVFLCMHLRFVAFVKASAIHDTPIPICGKSPSSGPTGPKAKSIQPVCHATAGVDGLRIGRVANVDKAHLIVFAVAASGGRLVGILEPVRTDDLPLGQGAFHVAAVRLAPRRPDRPRGTGRCGTCRDRGPRSRTRRSLPACPGPRAGGSRSRLS